MTHTNDHSDHDSVSPETIARLRARPGFVRLAMTYGTRRDIPGETPFMSTLQAPLLQAVYDDVMRRSAVAGVLDQVGREEEAAAAATVQRRQPTSRESEAVAEERRMRVHAAARREQLAAREAAVMRIEAATKAARNNKRRW